MADDGAFLRGIPQFLRRPVESAPEDPVFMTPRDMGPPPPAHIPAAHQAPAVAPARRPGSLLSPPPPVQAAPEPANVVSLQNLFATGAPAAPAAPGRLDEAGDVAFQVTLPRSVIRQVRILAAQEGTTQRAIVLRALRLAGLAVPEGADIDRRILAGRRRQQA